MKIAIDVTPILPGGKCGGAKQVVMELLRGFGQRATSEDFMLLTASHNHDFFYEAEGFGMERICVSKMPSGKSHLMRRIFNKVKKSFSAGAKQDILKRNGVSVLFCPMTAPTYHEDGVPTVSTVYDLQHLYYPSFFSDQELMSRMAFYEQLKEKVDYVTCISSFTRNSVIEKLNIPAERTFTVPICIHSRLAIPSDDLTESVLRRFDLSKRTYCFYPANLWPHKNHEILLVAFNMFTRRHPEYNLHLVLTGEKISGSEIIEDEIRQMGLEKAVHFLGYLSEDELSAIWNGSYFLIFPSLFEGFGIPLVEAMMYGKPILASSVTSIPEVAGDAAIYFDPMKPEEIVNAMRRIMEDKRLYRNLVAEGHKRLNYFDYNKMIDGYLSIIRKAGIVQHDRIQ